MKFSTVDNLNSFLGDVTIVVNSCDAYSDVLELFFKALDEYWPDNQYPVVVNTESSTLLGYTEEQKGGVTWGQRLIDLLYKIETEYVVMVFDDFLLEDFVDKNKLNAVFNLLQSDRDSSVFYLNAACVSDHVDEPENDYRLLKDGVDFRLNSVPAVWKREELIRYTRGVDSPWAWEVFGSYRTFNKGRNFYSSSSQQCNIFRYNYKKGGAIYRGKWVREVVEDKIQKYGLDIDLERRGIVDFSESVDRTFGWKVSFLVTGYKSIGFGVLRFVFRYVKTKLKRVFK